jgi:large subunit ribosomal protein MRP49
MSTVKSIPKSGISRQLAKLNLLASGPGSVKLPPSISRLNLKFQKGGIASGHLGAQRFWKDMLPRVQFHNPQLPISVQRYSKESTETGEKPVLTVIFGGYSTNLLRHRTS